MTRPGAATTARFLQGRRVHVALVAAALALVVVSVVSYRGLDASIESEQWVRHTHEVLEQLQDLQARMQSIEASDPLPSVTPDAAQLESYRSASAGTQRGGQRLRQLMADNPDQLRRLSALEALADRLVKSAGEAIRVRQDGGPRPAVAEGIEAQRLRDEWRDVLHTMQTAEWRLLFLRAARAKGRVAQAKTVLILGDSLSLLIAVAAVFTIRRDERNRRHAERALRESEEQYRLLIDGVRDYSIFMMDPQGRVVSWNAGAERIKGYRADQIIGRGCWRTPCASRKTRWRSGSAPGSRSAGGARTGASSRPGGDVACQHPSGR